MLINMTEQEFEDEKDMLRGNLNRMCVSHDRQEVLHMYNFARKRLERIYMYNLDRIDQTETLQQHEQYQQLEMKFRNE